MASKRSKKTPVREIAVGDDEQWAEALEAWDDRLDDQSARDAAQLFEDLAHDLGDDPNAFAWCARANYFVGDYASSRESGKFFQRGTELGRKAIKLDDNHIGARFWTSCSLAAYAETLNILRRAAVGPELIGYMSRVWEKEPTYFHRGVARFVGQAMVRQGGLVTKLLSAAMPDIGPERVLEELETSIKTDPPFVLTHQTLGQLAWQQNSDGKTVEKMRKAIAKLDLDKDPSLAPENHRDKARALETLENIG